MTEARLKSYTWKDLCKGRVSHETNTGIWVGFVCNDGSGRSFNAAKNLVISYGINGFYFRQGLKHIIDAHWGITLPYTIQRLNEIAYLTAILTSEEVKYFYPIISQISCYTFSNSILAATEMAYIVTNPTPRFRFGH